MSGTTNDTAPRIALDGPSALAFYRDRAEVDSQSQLFDTYVVRTEPEPRADADGDAWLSDEDIAATLAETNIFGHCSDFESVLQSPADVPSPTIKRTRMRTLSQCASSSQALRSIPYGRVGVRPSSGACPLYLLIPNNQRRRRINGVCQRVCTAGIPDRSFYTAEDIVCVPTPEFTFVLMARYLNLLGLMMLAMELCGYYRLLGATTLQPLHSLRALYGQQPLTSVARLRSFVDRAEGFYGISACRRALDQVANNAASPMETILYLMLCLPRRYGGYGVKRPILNAKLPVNALAHGVTAASNLVPDLYWPSARLDMEYDSEEFHTDADSLQSGRRRTLALQAMDVQVISMSIDILRSHDSFDVVASTIMRALGQRRHKATETDRQKRIALRNSLLFRDDIYRK